MKRERIIHLDVGDLAVAQQSAWVELASAMLTHSEVPGRVLVYGGCAPDVQSTESASLAWVDGKPPKPDRRETFVYLSGSAVFSRKLVRRFARIYLAPRSAVAAVDDSLYLAYFAACEHSKRSAWQPEAASRRRTTLITSVFAADVFLPGFLENCAGLDGYGEDEHLLVLAGSPGNELSTLLRHVCACPGAVVINLPEDPGLYEVWNLVVRLATGRYLTSANVDDQRAPEQLSALTRMLDKDAGIDVACSALRVSTIPNLRWPGRDESEVMFRSVPSGRYGYDDLFKRHGNGIRSRNLPHCMPVWRRSLHRDFGDFDGRRNGPSADWEFWLRATVAGRRVGFTARVLGLYLRHSDSYWHRHGEAEAHDRAIVVRYQKYAASAPPPPLGEGPAALALARLTTLYDHGSCAEILTQLEHFTRLELATRNGAARVTRGIARRWLSAADERPLKRWLDSVAADAGRRRNDELLPALLDQLGGCELPPWGRSLLEFACVDLWQLEGDNRWLLVLARVRGLGKVSGEERLLRHLHTGQPQWFWRTVQWAYRFTVALARLAAAADDLPAFRRDIDVGGLPMHIAPFPAYRGNTYLRLLYGRAVEDGATVRPIRSVAELESLNFTSDRTEVVHVHWLNAIFEEGSGSLPAERADRFIAALERARRGGAKILWTVHNRLSHHVVCETTELALRRRLYAIADSVILHHPVVAWHLDWLPGTGKLRLLEHGSYAELVPFTSPARQPLAPRQAARRSLGLTPDDLVLIHFGQLRAYKGLEDTFPVLRDCWRRMPRLKVVVAGRCVCDQTRRMLEDSAGDNLLWVDRRLDDAALARHLAAADFGFLSYRSIETSGASFHLMSAAVPIIAPALGALPAYVVDGWNGFLYRDPQDLGAILQKLLELDLATIRTMGLNAFRAGGRLPWQF